MTMNNRAQFFVVTSIVLVLAIIVFVGSYYLFNDNEITPAMVSNSLGVRESSLSYNGVTLTDRTNYYPDLNLCSASHLGMEINVYPCIGNTLFGKDITQYVNFTWTGGSPQNTSWIFVYEGTLQSGKMFTYQNISYLSLETIGQNQSVSGVVDKITSFVNLGTPDNRCQVGNRANTQMYNVTRNLVNGTTSTVYCFTSATQVNSTAYNLAGNITQFVDVNLTKYRMDYVDVTSSIQYMGYGLLGDNRSYYRVNSVVFQPGQIIQTKWVYTPTSNQRAGKWHILGFNGNTGLINSINSDQYIYLDPWWNLAVPYKRYLNFTTGDAINVNYTHRMRINYQSEFGTTCTNTYVVWQDTLEIDSDIRVCNSTTLEIAFRNQNATAANTYDTNYSLYYGASTGSRKSDNTVVYFWNDDMTISNSSKYSTFTNPGTFSGGLVTFTANLRPNVVGNFKVGNATGGMKNFTVEFQANLSATTSGQLYIGAAAGQMFTGSNGIAIGSNNQRNLVASDAGGFEDAGSNVIGSYTTGLFNYSITVNATTGRATNSSLSLGTPYATLSNFITNSLLGAAWTNADDSGTKGIDFLRIMSDVDNRPTYNVSGQIDNAALTVEVNYPANGYNFVSNSILLSCNTTAIGTNISNTTLSLYNSSSFLLYRNTNTTFTNMTFNSFVWNATMPDGENYIWGCTGYSIGNIFSASVNRTFNIDTTAPILTINAPQNNSNLYSRNSTFSSILLNWTATDARLNTCYYNSTFNSTPTIFACGNGTSNYTYVNVTNIFGLHNFYVYANDTLGGLTRATANFTLHRSIYDTHGYETQNKTFSLVVYNQSISSPPTNAILTLNITNYTATITNASNDGTYQFNVTLDLPTTTTPSPRSFYWNWNNGAQLVSNLYNITVNTTNFTLCNPVNNVSFINFTFQDETSFTNINASISSSTWTYYMGSGSVNKSFFFSNITVNPSYGFCFIPKSGTVTTTIDNLVYTSSGYPSRTYVQNPIELTNLTTNVTLYLLSSSSGVYSSILVVEGLGTTPIVGANVLVQVQLGDGSYATVGNLDTDSSGIATFWLNPATQYRYSVSASGYTSEQFFLYPSQSIYTVRLSPITNSSTPYNSSLVGYKWQVTPRVGTLQPGVHQFNFTMESLYGGLYGCRISLINVTNPSQTFNSSEGVDDQYACNITVSYNLVNTQNIFGKIEVNNSYTNGEFQVVDTDYKWILIDFEINSGTTIINFFTRLGDLSEFGGDGNRQEFSRVMFFFLISTILIAAFTYITGFELQNPGVALALIWFLVAIASIAGFLSFDSGTDRVSPFFEQYGILLIYSTFAGGYLINQIRRQS